MGAARCRAGGGDVPQEPAASASASSAGSRWSRQSPGRLRAPGRPRVG